MRAAGVEANLVPPGPGAFSGGALGGADGLPCRTREGPTRRGQAGWMGRLGQPYGEPGLHGRCGACPAGGRCELVVGYNGEHQLRTAYRHPALCRRLGGSRSSAPPLFQAAWRLRQGRSAEYGVLHRCGPVELLCWCVPATRIARPKQEGLGAIWWATAAQETCPGRTGNFIRWVSGKAARGGRRVPQGWQLREIPPSFSP